MAVQRALQNSMAKGIDSRRAAEMQRREKADFVGSALRTIFGCGYHAEKEGPRRGSYTNLLTLGPNLNKCLPTFSNPIAVPIRGA